MMALIGGTTPNMPEHNPRGRTADPQVPEAHDPVEVNEVPSGTAVSDWTAPREWSIRSAYIAGDVGTWRAFCSQQPPYGSVQLAD